MQLQLAVSETTFSLLKYYKVNRGEGQKLHEQEVDKTILQQGNQGIQILQTETLKMQTITVAH